MKYIFLPFLLIGAILPVSAQKKLVDAAAFDKWVNVQDGAISSDGKYVVYTIDNKPLTNHTLVIQAITNKSKKEIIGASEACFTPDGKKLIYKLRGDSLCVLQLRTGRYFYYDSVQAYKLLILKKKELLVMQMSNEDKELRINDLTDSKTKSFFHVSDYIFSKDGKTLLLQIEKKSDGQTKNIVQWTDLEQGSSQVIWHSGDNSEKPSHAGSFAFDDEGERVIFNINEKIKGKSIISLWYYKAGMANAVQKLNSHTPGLPERCIIGNGRFSRNGICILFDIDKRPNEPSSNDNAITVDLWSYTDDKLQAQQLKEAKAPISYKAGINLTKNEVFILQRENETLYDDNVFSEYKVLTSSPCYYEESNWRHACRTPLYLINTNDGNRRIIKDSLTQGHLNAISPNGMYAIYYDLECQAFFSYTIRTGKTVNISQNIPFPVFDKAHARATLPPPFTRIKSWLPNDEALIMYDEFDIWQVDPAGQMPPVCLTNGYGRKNGIILHLLKEGQINSKEILLIAFRPSDKINGFFKLRLDRAKQDPELLSMGPYFYYWRQLGGAPPPVVAAKANIWLVQRQSISEAPNYFITKDFKRYQRISDVQPQKNYNWLTDELHEWTMFDGKKSKGILYKPENFDSTKKYPVIFNFYEEKSDDLNKYLIPEATGSNINIPHFVSNGYLLFVPDIYYTIGETSESIYNSVGSAAHYLSKYSWVDSTKMSLQGHSFGAYEVDALISRTNIFAASSSFSGFSDVINQAFSINAKEGNSLAYLSETSTNRMGATLWENPHAYIKNSPIFFADRISTPLLMVNNKEDDIVPFNQGVEWFTALRRLGKSTWMLQYDNFGHDIWGKPAEDYTIRLMQFFDHYLKAKPAPRWMTQGIPAKLKGIESRYELDPNGSCGKDCKVCKQWNEQYKKTPELFTKPASEWQLDPMKK